MSLHERWMTYVNVVNWSFNQTRRWGCPDFYPCRSQSWLCSRLHFLLTGQLLDCEGSSDQSSYLSKILFPLPCFPLGSSCNNTSKLSGSLFPSVPMRPSRFYNFACSEYAWLPHCGLAHFYLHAASHPRPSFHLIITLTYRDSFLNPHSVN